MKAWATNLWPVRQILAPMIRKQTAAGAARTLPGAVRAHRSLASRRIEHHAAAQARSALDGEARGDADRAVSSACSSCRNASRASAAASSTASSACTSSVRASWAAISRRGVRSAASTGAAGSRDEIRAARSMLAERCSATQDEGPHRARACAFSRPTSRATASSADLAIEAIFEKPRSENRSSIGRPEPSMKKDALLATNTSSIPLDELRHPRSPIRRVFSGCTISIRSR